MEAFPGFRPLGKHPFNSTVALDLVTNIILGIPPALDGVDPSLNGWPQIVQLIFDTLTKNPVDRASIKEIIAGLSSI